MPEIQVLWIKSSVMVDLNLVNRQVSPVRSAVDKPDVSPTTKAKYPHVLTTRVGATIMILTIITIIT